MNIIVLQIIAAFVALAGSIVNLLSLLINIPDWLSIASAVALLISAALWLGLYFINTSNQCTRHPLHPIFQKSPNPFIR